MMAPYFSAGGVDIYHGRCEDILPALGQFDAAIVDPPYQETSLRWDRWIPTLPELLANLTRSMWWFGSMRSFLDHADDFDSWSMSQDVVWEKHNGSGFHADRFKRVHEHAVHWYRGPWADLYKEVPTTADATKRTVRRKGRPTHMGEIEGSTYTSIDGGPRLMRSVIYARSMHGTALHPTEKPADILAPLIEYAAPPGGSILDPTCGSGSALAVARWLGLTAVGIEADERFCEVAATRLSDDLGLVRTGGDR